MQLVVKVTAEVAAALRASPTPDEAQALHATAERLALELVRQHPNTTDPELSRFLTARVPDAASGDQAAEAIRAVPGVEQAFVKPSASPARP